MQPKQLIIDGKQIALTKNQRNLYRYYLTHQSKNTRTPCFVPRNPIQGHYSNGQSRDETYLEIIERLEKLGLFRVDRTSDNYTGWILLPPV